LKKKLPGHCGCCKKGERSILKIQCKAKVENAIFPEEMMVATRVVKRFQREIKLKGDY
jgi:hypothetical protein